jgi:hypothetical protein
VTPAQQFEAWRAELVTELESVQEALPAARSAVQAAQAAHAAAQTAWLDLNRFAAAAVPNHGSMSGPLYSRVMKSRDALDEAERARGAPLAAVEALTNRVADLQLAIAQVDCALTAAKVVQLPRPAVETSRRKPQVIDYDNIEMSRDAAS